MKNTLTAVGASRSTRSGGSAQAKSTRNNGSNDSGRMEDPAIVRVINAQLKDAAARNLATRRP